jgi:hypothetical protein
MGKSPMPGHPYAGMIVALATMHRKQEAIAPPLADLGMNVQVPGGIDTDTLGTFSGEVPRFGTMLEVAVKKARLGMAAMGTNLGLASEGTFGPHPQLGIIPAGMELLVLVDDHRGAVISESLLVEEINFAHLVVEGKAFPKEYLKQVKFPSHGLIVRPNAGDANSVLHKGIVTAKDLRIAISQSAAESPDGKALVQTDMRAHFNPTRMRSLAKLAARMAKRLSSLCLECCAPGFGTVDIERGLPCEFCGVPTRYVLNEILGCVACNYRKTLPRSDGLKAASQIYCEHCNP